jgi:hypothetical protein
VKKAELSNKKFEKVVKPPKILNTSIITIGIADTCWWCLNWRTGNLERKGWKEGVQDCPQLRLEKGIR